MTRQHTVHDPAGYTTPNGITIRCTCGRIATWRRRRNSRPTIHECALCRAHRTATTR